MLKIKPLLTEKSLLNAQNGVYTFSVGRNATKTQIKNTIQLALGVKVAKVRTVSMKKAIKKNMRGQKRTIPATKKAIITLKGKDKIDLFESNK